MQVTYPCCCGLDVHKKLIVACLFTLDAKGHKHKEIRSFETVTEALLTLADWLKTAGCTHIAIESTGVYWKPVFNILEGSFNVWLVNPRHIKAVPGRKTDVSDSEWLAELLQHGLLRASFIPPLAQRELRDLTRYRTNLVEERARLLNRIQKLLEDANLKLAGVVTDISGLTARKILNTLAAGETDPAVLSELAQGSLRTKKAQLETALRGRVKPHHQFILA